MFQKFFHRLKQLNPWFPCYADNGCLNVNKRFDSNVSKLNIDGEFVNMRPKSERSQSNNHVKKALEAAGYDNLHHIPSRLLRRNKKNSTLHLIDKNVAEDFVSMIIPDLQEQNSRIIEMNPGLGYVTEKLLAHCSCPIDLFEKVPEFVIYLQPLINQYPDRLSIEKKNLLSSSALEYEISAANERRSNDISNNIKQEYSDKSSVYIIGTVAQMKSLYHLNRSIISGYLSKYSNVTLYLMMRQSTTRIWNDMEFPIRRTANNIILQVLFKPKTLGVFPNFGFIPWFLNSQNSKLNKKHEGEDEMMHVVKLVINQDFLNNDFTKREAEKFFYFLAMGLRRRDANIIPLLEKWIPNCGPRLIKQNYTIYTRFSELSAWQLVDLFNIFKSWPEYNECIFQDLFEEVTCKWRYKK